MRKLAQRVGRRGLLSVIIALVICLSAMLGLLASSSSDTTDTAVREGPTSTDATPVRALALAMHDPIYIDGNAGFTNASGVVGGIGTESDPYIIAGWDINASTAMIGISINDTDSHFIVKNCYVHESDGGYPSYPGGINLRNCTNGTLESNTCSNKNHAGIKLESSSNNTVSNNSCSGNYFEGIWLDDSSDITLSSNTCWGNLYGILLTDSRNNTLISNNCSNNYYGIHLSSSSNNALSSNNCSSNSGYGMWLYYSSSNTVSGNNCSSNGESGISLEQTFGNILSYNNCSNNHYGIHLLSSSNNALSNNNCSSNTDDGVRVHNSDGNIFNYNTCSNNEYGMYLAVSSGNTVVYNTCSKNAYGMRLEYGTDNVVSCNTCSSNSVNGIYVYSLSDHAFTNNNCSSNGGYGMFFFHFTSNNMIWNNTFHFNNGAGDSYDPSHVQAYDEGIGNMWNSTDGYGNYWSDWTSPDVDMNGIVDDPYVLDGGAGAKDNCPLTTTPSEPIPEFGMMPFVVMILLVAIMLTIGARRRKAP